jgi:hypothetical protein
LYRFFASYLVRAARSLRFQQFVEHKNATDPLIRSLDNKS